MQINVTDILDLGTVAKRFRFVAFFEALTWVGLLVGMTFKYVPTNGTEIGVKIFGPLHGAAFLLYLTVAGWTIYRLRWGFLTAAAAIIASVPPLGTFVFEKWVAGTGRLAELSKPGEQRAEVSSVT